MRYDNSGKKKLFRKNLFLILILVFLFQACKKAEDSSEVAISNKDIILNLDNKLDSMYSQIRVPGIYVGIRATDRDLTYEKTRGYSDFSTFRFMNANDLYRIGYVTNSFTTTVLLQLVDENRISLDSMLNKYIPTV
ncbi:MAG: serine hydrolase, partial [Ignavibacteriae bacterium]|nr:serine hydrolase [Ignavibacteriota bacterium]